MTDTAAGKQWGIVIGAGAGMGRSLALVMARENLAVCVVARTRDTLDGLFAELAEITGSEDNVAAWTADAADPAAIGDLVTDIASRGELACLAYNAAAFGGPLLTTAPHDLASSLAVNALSAVAAVRAATESLSRTSGAVLITGGGLAHHPSADMGVLSLGKAALRTTALLLAEELAPRGVTVRTLTIAGGVGTSPEFDPDRIADEFWRTINSPSVETIYTGTP